MKKRIIGRSSLFFFGTLLTIVELVVSIALIIKLERGLINVSTYEDKIGGQCIFAMLGLCVIAIYIAVLPKWLTIYEFSRDGICVCKPFSHNKIQPYERYKHIYSGYYHHSHFIKPHYIVISKKIVSEKKLSDIRTLDASEDVIVVKDSKKNRETLKYYLPERLYNNLTP